MVNRAESSQFVLTDDLAQLFDDSGEHRLRLISPAPLRDVPVTLRFAVRVCATRYAASHADASVWPILAVLAPSRSPPL